MRIMCNIIYYLYLNIVTVHKTIRLSRHANFTKMWPVTIRTDATDINWTRHMSNCGLHVNIYYTSADRSIIQAIIHSFMNSVDIETHQDIQRTAVLRRVLHWWSSVCAYSEGSILCKFYYCHGIHTYTAQYSSTVLSSVGAHRLLFSIPELLLT